MIRNLLLLLIYVLINRKNLHLMMLYTGIIILINIPSVPIIILWHGNIENKVFVKLINQTKHKLTDITLYGNLKKWNIGELNNTSSKVINYDPPYRTNHARLYQKPDTLRLIFTHNEVVDTVGFPTISMGDCRQLIIDENLKIKAHNNGEHEEPL